MDIFIVITVPHHKKGYFATISTLRSTDVKSQRSMTIFIVHIVDVNVGFCLRSH